MPLRLLLLALLVAFCSCALLLRPSLAGIIAEPVGGGHDQPYTVPAFPVDSAGQICKLDLSAELFGGVSEACGRNLDRSRCCPVLAAWLFAAHARYALQVAPAAAPSSGEELPMIPDDSQKCVNSLQSALVSKNVHLPQPNASCDAVLCFCGIRVHQISSLSCPAAFNVSSASRNVTPTAAVRNLEKSCRNSSYAGCTKCLGALQKLKGGYKNGTGGGGSSSDRTSRMLDRDCQLMGLTWLLARNKTAYIPTVSAALRAIMYSWHPPEGAKCSPDQENMPLAVDSLQFERAQSSSAPSLAWFPILPSIMWFCLFI
ncbi:uncharacterized GPI-anchored protein At4g28100 [Eucalyptus grandis]|uniref:Uncharacterized protein n=2 Tax=Eucalyptus grandis TaxID=71139 RepID=A0ACC3M3T7_EUCGR|nr:uncharacterized GPI-anchored protein At4g28100 [Eucalyptus grandis]KAK3446002.1 hypothetical protein EUGRSUZ_A01771 [Eucalyptus grandis]